MSNVATPHTYELCLYQATFYIVSNQLISLLIILYFEQNIKRKGVAPDISNEEYFPTLGANKPDVKNSKGFESIKHGAKPQKQSLGSAPLSTENRFTSLSDAS